MRRWVPCIGVLALAAVSTFGAAPAEATHGGDAEGTVTVMGAETCSTEDANPGDGKCEWKATDDNGWAGSGPFELSWVGKNKRKGSYSCPPGEFCQSDEQDFIPGGSSVTSDGSGGGSFAAGDADTSD